MFILCLGEVVVQEMLGKDSHVKDLRGKWHLVMGIPAIVSYHPMAIRRRPNLMKQLTDDLRMLAPLIK
jgi:DNA polymerase